LFFSYKLDSKKFALFILLGYVFLIVGVAKLGIMFVNRKKESSVEKRQIKAGAYQQNYAKQRAVQRKMPYCIKCRSRLYGYENFCPKCGQRLR
jgi:hypothetical protein